MDDAYGPVRKDEIASVCEILSWCFHFPAEDAKGWLERAGLEHVRVYRDGGAPVACLLFIPMGQWFGGRSIPMMGVAGVGTSPESRGRGAADKMMAAAIRELAARKIPLSGLYPATRALYRRSGYELAGARYLGAARIDAIKVRADEPEIIPMTAGDFEAVKRLYSERAVTMNGFLDRGPYIWDRIRAPRIGPAPRGYLIRGDAGLEGYFFVGSQNVSPERADLKVTDLVALTPAAARRALAFFAHHWTLVDHVRINTGPADPLALAFPEESFKTEIWHHYLLRVVDVPGALAARGYHPAIEIDLELEVTDALVPENAGRFVVAIGGGAAQVLRGGRGGLKLDVRGLAALLSGYLAPPALRDAGLLDGDEQALALAALAFAGQAPWMPDGF